MAALEPHLELRAHIRCVAWLPGDRIVTGLSDHTARIWDLKNGMQVGSSMDHTSHIEDIVTTQDGRIVSCCPNLQHLKVWNADTQEPVDGPWSNEHGPAKHIFLSQNEQLLASCHLEWIVFWDMVETMRVRNHIQVDTTSMGYVAAGRFSLDGMRFAVAFTHRGEIAVFDVESGEGIFSRVSDRETITRDIVWSPDGARLFCGCDDGNIHCFDAHTVESIGTSWKAHNLKIKALSLSPDGKRLTSAARDRTTHLQVWDLESGNPVGPLQDMSSREGDYMDVVVFSPSGEYLASGWKQLLIWRVPWWDDDTGKTLHPLLDMSAVVPSDGPSNTPDLDFLDISAPRRPLPLQERSGANPPHDPPRVQSAVSSWQWWKRIPRLVFYRVHAMYPGYAPPRTYVASRETVDTASSPSSPSQTTDSEVAPEVLASVAESSSSSEGSTNTPTAGVEPEVSEIGCCGLLPRRRHRTTATGAARDTPQGVGRSSRPARIHPSDSNNAGVAAPASTRSATQDILELSAVV